MRAPQTTKERIVSIESHEVSLAHNIAVYLIRFFFVFYFFLCFRLLLAVSVLFRGSFVGCVFCARIVRLRMCSLRPPDVCECASERACAPCANEFHACATPMRLRCTRATHSNAWPGVIQFTHGTQYDGVDATCDFWWGKIYISPKMRCHGKCIALRLASCGIDCVASFIRSVTE